MSHRLNVPVEDAFGLLRRYARTHAEHLTDTARLVISGPEQRESILATLTELASRPGGSDDGGQRGRAR